MAYLHECYTAKCRFFHDSDRVDEIEWYFAPQGAARFLHYTIFNTSAYMDKNQPTEDWKYPGELPNTKKHSKGKNIWGYKGKAGCMVGTPQQFATGLSIKDAKPVTLPQCCATPPQPACIPTVISATVKYVGFPWDISFFPWHDVYITLMYDSDIEAWTGSGYQPDLGLIFDIVWTHDPLDEFLNFVGHTDVTVSGLCQRHGKVSIEHDNCRLNQPFSGIYGPFANNDLFGCGIPSPQPGHWEVWLVEAPPPSWICQGGIHLGYPPWNLIIASGGITISGSSSAEIPPAIIADGTITLSGSSDAELAPYFIADGTITISGSSDAELVPYFIADGTITISGSSDAELAPPANSQGPRNPQAGNNVTGTDVAWSNPANGRFDDGSYATVALGSSEYSRHWAGTNFGFTVPSGATIAGIEIRVKWYQSGSGVLTDLNVYLRSGTTNSENRAAGAALPGIATEVVYGGPWDNWGLTLSGTDVDSSGFAARVAVANDSEATATAYLDSVSVKLYWE